MTARPYMSFLRFSTTAENSKVQEAYERRVELNGYK